MVECNTAYVLAGLLRCQYVSMYFETLKMHKNNEEVFYAANFLYFFFHAWLFLNFTFDESRLAKNNKIKMF